MLERKLVIAHRGASGDEPENTLEAIGASIARGVEAIEIDVRQTADGVVVLAHDAAVRGRVVARSTLEELRARVPDLCTLRQVLDEVPDGCLVNVEIKTPGMEEEVLRELRLKGDRPPFVVTSFHDVTVARVKALDPEVEVGLVLGQGNPKSSLSKRLSEFFPYLRLRRSHADLIVLHKWLIRMGVLRRMAWLGYPVWVWTVNKPSRIRRMLAAPEVTAIITDRAVEAMALRAELEPPS